MALFIRTPRAACTTGHCYPAYSSSNLLSPALSHISGTLAQDHSQENHSSCVAYAYHRHCVDRVSLYDPSLLEYVTSTPMLHFYTPKYIVQQYPRSRNCGISQNQASTAVYANTEPSTLGERKVRSVVAMACKAGYFLFTMWRIKPSGAERTQSIYWGVWAYEPFAAVGNQRSKDPWKSLIYYHTSHRDTRSCVCSS